MAVLTHGESWEDLINVTAGAYNIPAWIPLAIAKHESGGNINAVVKDTNGAYSVGLFQLNEKGVGAGYSVQQLQDPNRNARLAIRRMVPAYKAAVEKGLKGQALLDYVANNSGWPGDLGVTKTNAVEPSYDKGLHTALKTLEEQGVIKNLPTQNNTPRVVKVADKANTPGTIKDTLMPDILSGLKSKQAINVYVILAGIVILILLIYRFATH